MMYNDSYNLADISEWNHASESDWTYLTESDYVMEASIFSKIKEKLFKGKAVTKRQVASTPHQTPSQTVQMRLYGGVMTGPVDFINGCNDSAL